MIDKKRPRKLDSSKDSRVRAKDSLSDARNINVDGNYDGDQEGSAGVIKLPNGNLVEGEFEGLVDPDTSNPYASTTRVVGSVLDDRHNVLYYFLFSSDSRFEGVYAYDPEGFFPEKNSNANKIKLIYRSPLLKFDSKTLVKGDIVMLSKNHSFEGTEYDVDPVLYFTDGINEPRKIHVLDAYFRIREKGISSPDEGGLNTETVTDELRRFDFFDDQDYIHACPKTPIHPIVGRFKNDPDTRVSNFEGMSGMQFAYQYIYRTGEESALSTYSDIYVPPAYSQQGARPTARMSSMNIFEIRIPTGRLRDEFSEEVDLDGDGVDDQTQLDTSLVAEGESPSTWINRYLPKNIKSIRILMREGNSGAFLTVDTIDISNPYKAKYEDITYDFRNDRVLAGFSSREAIKPFDNVPLKASAQVASSDRIMYGDYTSGYDNVNISATATISYKSRPEDFKEIDIEVRPTIDLLNQGNDASDVNNRRASFYFSTDGFPDDGLEDGTTVDIVITARPKRNWHIYDSRGSFHGSRHMGNLESSAIDPGPDNNELGVPPYAITPNLASDGISGVPGSEGEPGFAGNSRSRTDDFSNLGLDAMFGRNSGVGKEGVWRTVDSQAGVSTDIQEENFDPSTLAGASCPAAYGTAASNPFILRGRPLLFALSFKITRNLSQPAYKGALREFIERSINGQGFADSAYQAILEDYFQILDVNTSYDYIIDEGLDGGDANTPIDDIDDESRQINVRVEGDDRKHLIVAVGNGDKVNPEAAATDLKFQTPCGYFIVNKARPYFSLRSRNNLPSDANYGVLHINLDRVEDIETLTCIPFMDSDIWKEKQLKLDTQHSKERGPENTTKWYNQNLVRDLSKPENWGLRDASIWQFETMVLDRWYCLSKEFLVYNTLPPFLFTNRPLDYARYLDADIYLENENGEIEISDLLAGDINPEVSNGGRLKNAAVVREQHIIDRIFYNSENVGFAGSPENKLHFRHNVRLQVGGDGLLPAILGKKFNVEQIGPANYESGRGRIIGYLDSGDSWFGDIDGNVFSDGDFAGLEDYESGFTILDGMGGIGATPSGSEARHIYDDGKSYSMGSVSGTMIMKGYIGPRSVVLPSKIKDGTKPPLDLQNESGIGDARYENYFNKFGQASMMPYLGQFNYVNLSVRGGYMWVPDGNDNAWPGDGIGAIYYGTNLDALTDGQPLNVQDNHDWTDDYRVILSSPNPSLELLDVGGGTLLAGEIRSGGRSFKRGADHSFGIVFYDERGRSGKVNPISFAGGAKNSVYVDNYDKTDNKGRVEIEMLLSQSTATANQNIPDWATHYQIVYAGNSTKSRFIQYTTGGAYVASAPEGSADQESQNIYVSLNYLQGNKDVSYTEAFGAVSPSGTKQMYVHKPGDKLRVISYYTSFDPENPLENRVYPPDVEFEVVGVENISKLPEQNPFTRAFEDSVDSAVVSDAKSGQFLVLKNNVFAAGFSYQDVKSGENATATNQHYWNNICVVEIYSPSEISGQDEDQRLYYETSRVYDVGVSDGNDLDADEIVIPTGVRYYKTNPVIMSRGDVWFRRVAMAAPDFITDSDSEEFNRFENLVKYNADNDSSSIPKFKDYYLESQTFNDTFSGNNVTSKGKPNNVDDEFGQYRNISSITYSDKHQYDKSKNRFSSFNSVDSNNFKTFPSEYGKINYLVSNYDSIVILQENKSSAVPVERSILNTADGSSSLTQSKDVLGVQTFYAGDYGPDNHPESVLKVGGTIYFASRTNREVYRLTQGRGVEVISSMGLKSAFYDAFGAISNNSALWIPTGYDPLNDEFLITIRTLSNLTPFNEKSVGLTSLGDVEVDPGEDVLDPPDPTISGCTIPTAGNFNPAALIEDNDTCIFFGCTEIDSTTYDPNATHNFTHPTTIVDGVEYETDDKDYQKCLFFNPCIFDALSLYPDGKVSYSDINEAFGLLGSNSATVPTDLDLEDGGFEITADIINRLGLDFVWASRLPADQQPPIEFSRDRDTASSWSDLLEEGVFGTAAFDMAVAMFSEGPSSVTADDGPGTVFHGFDNNPLVEPVLAFGKLRYLSKNLYDYAFNAIDDGLVDDESQLALLAFVNPWWNAWTPEPLPAYPATITLGVDYGPAPWSPNAELSADDFQIGGGNSAIDFGENEAIYGAGAGNASCPFVGCTDSTAYNHDPLAVEDCRIPAKERGRMLPSGIRDEGFGPDSIGCLGDISVDVVYCIDPTYQNCPAYQQTNIGNVGNFSNADGSFGGLSVNLNTNTYIVTNEDELSVLVDEINSTTNSAGCSYDANPIDASVDSTPCGCIGGLGGDGSGSVDDFLEPQNVYIYWDGCCQYICDGDYTFDDDGNEVAPEDWTGDFAPEGVPACRNFLYIAEDWLDKPNPDHDYNPNVSGIQQPE